MKSPVGTGQPRRQPAKQQVRLDLRRSKPRPSPEEEIEKRQKGNFWKWFTFVALFHVLLFLFVMALYRPSATPPPPEPFISLMPQGDTVKGSPGLQAAPQVGAPTPAPTHHHAAPKPPTPPEPVTPPPPAPTAVEPPPKPVVHHEPVIHEQNAPRVVEDKPKPKPTPPKPKVKVDLTLADGPAPTPEKHVVKPKHVKKTPPPATHEDKPDEDAAAPETMGLSKAQVAKKLGAKLEAEGTEKGVYSGPSGSRSGHENNFSDFYASIYDQVMNKWNEPNLDDAQAVNPVVQIHVDKDGHVAPDRVTLLTSSGNQAIDDSALSAARSLGYLLQPLPDRCPPDISITFKLTH